MHSKSFKEALAAEKINYAIKIINAYIVYDLDSWPKNLLTNFKLKKYFFGATNIVKSNDKEIVALVEHVHGISIMTLIGCCNSWC